MCSDALHTLLFRTGPLAHFISHAGSARCAGGGSARRCWPEVLENQAVTRVDVNEQNAGAHGFYLARGFQQVGRSELDGDGRPYPILHLALPHVPSNTN